MDTKQALTILFDGRDCDLTAEGYLDSIAALRRENSALARQVERTLDSKLRELFPRRSIEWYDTSVGIRYRILLLPVNPHFLHDIVEVRDLLAIDSSQVRTVKDHPMRERLSSNLEISDDQAVRFADRELASAWFRQHRRSVEGLPPDSFAYQLTLDELKGARNSAFVDISAPEGLSGIRPNMINSDCFRTQSGGASPIHQLVSALLWKHRLPHYICGRVEIYLLTQNTEDITNIEPYDVQLSARNEAFRNSIGENFFSIAVSGLDEFTTKSEWGGLWDRYVKPLKDRYLEQRGQGPSGKQAPDLERLQNSIPLYEEYLRANSIEDVLTGLAKRGDLLGELEHETARRIINDIDDLLKPHED